MLYRLRKEKVLKLLDNMEQGVITIIFRQVPLKILLPKAWSSDQEHHHCLEIVRQNFKSQSQAYRIRIRFFNQMPRSFLFIFRI